jgi:hypothetical protein
LARVDCVRVRKGWFCPAVPRLLAGNQLEERRAGERVADTRILLRMIPDPGASLEAGRTQRIGVFTVEKLPRGQPTRLDVSQAPHTWYWAPASGAGTLAPMGDARNQRKPPHHCGGRISLSCRLEPLLSLTPRFSGVNWSPTGKTVSTVYPGGQNR